MTCDVFISYSRKDTELADRICTAFDKAGISYFIDRQGIGGAAEFPDEIARAIKECRKMLFLASRNAYESKYTKREIFFAFNEKNDNDIIPYLIDDGRMPDSLRFVFSTTNIRNIREHPVETVLVNDILRLLGREPVSGALPEIPKRRSAFRLPDVHVRGGFVFAAVFILTVGAIFYFANRKLPVAPDDSARTAEIARRSDAVAPASSAQGKNGAEPAIPFAPTTAASSAATSVSAVATGRPQSVRTYRAGDYYNENGKEGVVFEVDATGRHGKIVGLKQAELPWCIYEEQEKEIATGATDEADGMKNMRRIMLVDGWREKYPAFAWCAAQGDGWYLPAIEELKKFMLDDSIHDAVNRTLSQQGGNMLVNKGKGGWYWSSSERGCKWWRAWYVNMSNGCTFDYDKYYYYYVRAVSAF